MNFEALYHEHKSMVYNLALSYVQNVEDAQEITQDVFVSVHQKLDSFKALSKLSTWMYRITINKCLDFTKAKHRKKRFAFITSLFHEDGAVKFESVEFKHPGVLLEDKEKIQNIFNAIYQLPDSQKTVIILQKLENKSLNEVAEIMDLSLQAATALVHRAKTNLAKILKLSVINE